MPKSDLASTYDKLRTLMMCAARGTTILREVPGHIQFKMSWPNPLKPEEPMWFGGVRAGKSAVGYHLMPVYTHPELVKTISPALRKQMTGKSCFSFRKPDPVLWRELKKLTVRAAKTYAMPMKQPKRKKK